MITCHAIGMGVMVGFALILDARLLGRFADIPYTRSGKKAELAVRDAVHGDPVKNAAALANPEALAHYRALDALQR